jgi:ring-1,2-phenylacetyl-CoA epoxidase subunit PaaC
MSAEQTTEKAVATRGQSVAGAAIAALDPALRAPLYEYLLRLGDDRLVLGHRNSEWCGHGPILEEDIATANIALDLIGQATLFLRLAGEVEGKGRNEDALAYFREAVEFRNAQMVELPKGDFGFTILRQFLFSAYSIHLLEQLQRSKFEPLAAIAVKALKETRYHLRHSAEWVVRLGDGTDESHTRVQKALDELLRYAPELFAADLIDETLLSAGIAADLSTVRSEWEAVVREVIGRATLTMNQMPVFPAHSFMARGGRNGAHTESLGHLLSEMQIVARSHPGAEW